MTDRATATYSSVSRVNHWLGALLFAGMLTVGFYLAYSGIEGEERRSLMGLHRATGVLMLLFALWRIGWRIRQGFPAPMEGMPAWQIALARADHWGLIICMLAMPASGVFLMSLLGGRGIDVYGLFTIPPIMEIEGIRPIGRQIHGIVAFTFAGLIGLHLIGALKHLLIDRDGTVQRMLRGRPAAV